MPCSHYSCFALAYYLVADNDRFLNLKDFLGRDAYLNVIANRTLPGFSEELGDKKSTLRVFIEIARIHNLDELDKHLNYGNNSPYFIIPNDPKEEPETREIFRKQFIEKKESIVIGALIKLSEYNSAYVISIIKEISLKGASENIRKKAINLSRAKSN